MTVRLDTPRAAPRAQAPAAPPAAEVMEVKAPTAASLPSAPVDGFEAAGPGVVPLTHRAFSKPMRPLDAGSVATAKVNVAPDIDLTNLRLDLNIEKIPAKDLVVTLTSPSGKTVEVPHSADDTPGVRGSFDLTQAFPGENPRGDWTLTVENKGTVSGGRVETYAVAVAGTTRPRPTPTGEPVEISQLAERYGWPEGGWQQELLRAADGKAGGDGKVSAAEIDAYLAAPDDLRFLTSSAMQQQRDEVKAAGGTKEVSAFTEGWQRELARRADANADGRLGGHELNDYLTTVKAGSASAETLWMPDQKAAPITARVSDHTGEGNLLNTSGMPDDAVLLTRDYMRISMHPTHRTPNWVAYQLSGADVKERPPGVVRPADFSTDHQIGSLGSFDRDYVGSGYDRGHMKPARDSVNQEAMDESMLLSNIAPQRAALNQRAWEMLEQGTWELAQATGGKATVFTGGLFLDDQGKPLPEDQKQWIGQDGQKMVAVPTHYFKAVLLTMPDGSQKSYAYMLPNRSDLPEGNANDYAALLQQHRLPVDQVEALLGEDLFGALEDGLEQEVEAEDAPTFEFEGRDKFRVANLLWPKAGEVPSFNEPRYVPAPE